MLMFVEVSKRSISYRTGVLEKISSSIFINLAGNNFLALRIVNCHL
jgi:hypothetical protein